MPSPRLIPEPLRNGLRKAGFSMDSRQRHCATLTGTLDGRPVGLTVGVEHGRRMVVAWINTNHALGFQPIASCWAPERTNEVPAMLALLTERAQILNQEQALYCKGQTAHQHLLRYKQKMQRAKGGVCYLMPDDPDHRMELPSVLQAVEQHDLAGLAQALSKPFDPYRLDPQCRHALSIALHSGFVAGIHLLLDRHPWVLNHPMPGPYIWVKTLPLHYAVLGASVDPAGMEGVVERLLALGANPHITTYHGDTAYRLAILGQQTALADRFEAHGCGPTDLLNPEESPKNTMIDLIVQRRTSLPVLKDLAARGLGKPACFPLCWNAVLDRACGGAHYRLSILDWIG